MKKLVLLSMVMLASAVAFAQSEFKPFRVGLGTGYAVPQGDGAKGGIVLYLEPSYRVSDAIALGLRLETAIMLRGTTYVISNTTSAGSGSVSASGSYTVNGQYYFSNKGFRPFVGAGLGLYSLASASFTYASNGNTSTSNTSDAVSGGTKFGFYPRIGFDASHFTMNIEYNIIGKSTNSFTATSNGVATTGTSETKNNYLAVKVGVFIGGGRRK
ncbi:MAG: hypothetical protein DI538_20780 [Azospira oryzae]|jgi:outer membrane protein W|nr:hypothetical protein [Cytophaga sp.]PZR31583.1 MAG: hypothetical protein DI538_20780 [Azospira oryzae]